MSSHRQRVVVMLVDDDQDDIEMARFALEQDDPPEAVITAANGKELLEYLNRAVGDPSTPFPDLILMDINMPEMNGITALSRLKADDQLRVVPVVMFTTSDSSIDIRDAYRHGSAGYITKPESYDALLEIARSIKKYWSHTVSLAERTVDKD